MMQTAEAETLTENLLTDEAIAAIVADAPSADPCAFVPTDAAGVDWVLKKLSAARAEAALIRENAEAMARACERSAEALEWKFGCALQNFARKELEGGKKKSVRLFHGVIGFRTKPAGVSVTNDAAALEWAKENCTEAIAYRLDKKALADALTATGEVLDFARLTPAEDMFYIK